MNSVWTIPDGLVFSPCKVDGAFWSEFHRLISYLGRPEELSELYKADPDQYREIIDCLITFVKETEAELGSKGHLKEISIQN